MPGTNQPTKGVTKGKDLSRMKVNAPCSLWPFLHLITLVDTKTATFQNNLASTNNIQQSLTLPESPTSTPMALILINTQAWSHLILRKPTVQYGSMAYSKNLFHFTCQIIFLKSYMEGCTFTVHLNKSTSTPKPTPSGLSSGCCTINYTILPLSF